MKRAVVILPALACNPVFPDIDPRAFPFPVGRAVRIGTTTTSFAGWRASR
jgi:hypothetical protein